jgi:hypothetical protein
MSTSSIFYLRCVSGSPQNFHTIMSYGCPNGASAPEVGRFSNPSIVINGVPIGHTADGNCARAISGSATKVAGFKTRASGEPRMGGLGFRVGV